MPDFSSQGNRRVCCEVFSARGYVATKQMCHHLLPVRPSELTWYSCFSRRARTSHMQCKKCLVGGRVQGVFYRATAARRAQDLKLRGYARNLPDGRVEVLACGEEEALHAFVSWLWVGSSAAKVTSVEVSDAPGHVPHVPPGFTTA
jgi:acylphosphatase